MSVNAVNVYAYIKDQYPECQAIYNTHISYVGLLSDLNKRIFFVCKEGKNNIRSYECSHTAVRAITRSCELDLTGSPLKDDCEIDVIDMSCDLKIATATPWTQTEESYAALDITRARCILNDYNVQRGIKEALTSMWILCDATDSDKTVMLQIGHDHDVNERGIVWFKGILPIGKLNIAHMMKTHMTHMKGPYKVDTSIDCIFNVKPNTKIKISWNSNAQNPNINDFRNSDVILYQSVKVGDTNSVAEHLWDELYILSIIKDDIMEFKKDADENPEPVYRCGRGIDMETLREKVISTLTEIISDIQEDVTDNIEMEAVVQKAKTKENIDVTDKLWEILKCCCSYKDLKAAFNIVFQCAAKCNIVNTPTNQNQFAEIIREVSQQRLAIPCLSGTEPMELLLEIGLEKVAKDYEYIFTESKICGVNDLEINKSPAVVDKELTTLSVRKSLHNAIQTTSLTNAQRITLLHTNNLSETHKNDSVGFQNSTFNRREIEYKLSKMAQIHLVLEHLLLIRTNLNLENVYNQISQQLLGRPVQPFKIISNMAFDNVEIPIITEEIIPLLENKDPHSRKILLSSQNKFKEVQTTFYYNIENIFPPNIFTGISTNDKEIIKENIYYCWEYTKFSNKRF